MADTFETFIAKERERLMKHRADALSRKAEIDTELSEIDREMIAIQAYEDAKRGKPARAPRAAGRRGSKREALLALIKNSPAGISRADILTQMDVKGDKKGEQSVSNALSALKKAGAIDSADGRYTTAG